MRMKSSLFWIIVIPIVLIFSLAALYLDSSSMHCFRAGVTEGHAVHESNLRLAACTVVKDDVPYLIEWIEYYRLQGFSKFWIFDDRSADKPNLLPQLFAQKYVGANLVEVHRHTTPGSQPSAYAKCYEWSKSQGFDWVGVMDTDEFWYSPIYESVAQFLEREVSNTSIGVVSVSQFRFGTNGQRDRFEYRVVMSPQSGSVHLENPRGVQLITRQHTMRGPYKIFGESAELIDHSHPNCSIPAKDGWHMCHTDTRDSKSLWRPGAVSDINVHFPNNILPGYTILRPDPSVFRGNHYYYRSIADAEKKSRDWNKPDPLQGVQSVDAYWNSVQDLAIQRFTNRLEASMKDLMN